jgi:hypothetical protein
LLAGGHVRACWQDTGDVETFAAAFRQMLSWVQGEPK